MAIDVPDYVSEAARRGLEWHAEGKSGDGVTDQTIREAREMADGSVSEDKLQRMGPWFQRHIGDMDAPKNKPDNEDFPGAGAVAWALWGGPTSGDIMRTANWAEETVERLELDDDDEYEEGDDRESKAQQLPTSAIFKTMTIEEKLAAAEALVASASAERDDLRATVEKLTVGSASEVESLKVEAAVKDSKVTDLEASLVASAKQIEELTAKVAELSAVQVSASAEAATIVAKVGVSPIDLPQGDSPVRATDAEIAEQYAAMPFGKERTEFLKKNRSAIFKSAK
jgi:hypothetical protein